MKQNDCIFCKIINNELPSWTLYEDDLVKVFLNINPISPGHTLIVPKKHYTDITDIPIDVLTHINEVSKNMYKLLKDKLNFIGFKFVQNNGSVQEIKHYHQHLIPIYNDKSNKSVEEIFEILKK